MLIDAGSPIRLSTIELTRARIVLQARRSAAAHPPAWAWSDDAMFNDRINVPRDELLQALGDVAHCSAADAARKGNLHWLTGLLPPSGE